MEKLLQLATTVLLCICISSFVIAESPPSQYFLEGFAHQLNGKPVPRHTSVQATNEQTGEIFKTITIFPNGFYSLAVIGSQANEITMKVSTTFMAGQQSIILPAKTGGISDEVTVSVISDRKHGPGIDLVITLELYLPKISRR